LTRLTKWIAIDQEELKNGLCLYAAPQRNHSGQVIAALVSLAPQADTPSQRGRFKTNVFDKRYEFQGGLALSSNGAKPKIRAKFVPIIGERNSILSYRFNK
jgi:hypothetical protein